MKPTFFSPEIDALAAAVMAVGEAEQRAGLDGGEPDGAAVVAVIETVRDELKDATSAEELTAIGVSVMEWCRACYGLGQTARRIRRRDFNSGRRLGRAEEREEAARQVWLMPLVAAAASKQAKQAPDSP